MCAALVGGPSVPCLAELCCASGSVPDGQRPHSHLRHVQPAHHHPVHTQRGAVPARGSHLLQPAGPAQVQQQGDPQCPPCAGHRPLRGLQPGLILQGRHRLLGAGQENDGLGLYFCKGINRNFFFLSFLRGGVNIKNNNNRDDVISAWRCQHFVGLQKGEALALNFLIYWTKPVQWACLLLPLQLDITALLAIPCSLLLLPPCTHTLTSPFNSAEIFWCPLHLGYGGNWGWNTGLLIEKLWFPPTLFSSLFKCKLVLACFEWKYLLCPLTLGGWYWAGVLFVTPERCISDVLSFCTRVSQNTV